MLISSLEYAPSSTNGKISIEKVKIGLNNYTELRSKLFQNGAGVIEELFPELKVVGIGTESLVVQDPDSPDKVISIGFKGGRASGVFPFIETRSFHNLLHTLFPEHIPKLDKVEGFRTRNTIREKVFGSRSNNGEVVELADKINKELKELGINAPFAIDYMDEKNAIIGKDGVAKYTDLVEGFAHQIRKLDVEKIKEYYMSKFSVSKNTIGQDKGWKRINNSLLILSELDIVNTVVSNMVENNNFDIGSPEYQKTISNFSFQDFDKKLSKLRIEKLVLFAISIINNGHIYKNSYWQK